MCGIVGIVSGFSNGLSSAEADVFQNMLFLDTLRGWDSTGVFAVDKRGNVQVHKDALHGPDFLMTKEWKTTRSDSIRDGKMLVGHNRAATRGDITDVNAHPFVVNDELVLVHNGSFRGSHKHLADVAVDSEAIAIHLEKTPDVGAALREVDAAFALVWYRVSTKTLHIVRNSERPLFIVRTSTGGYVFASELETILYACSRAGVKLDNKVESVPVSVLTTLAMGEHGSISFNKTEVDITYKRPSFPTQTNYPVVNARRFEPNWEVEDHDKDLFQGRNVVRDRRVNQSIEFQFQEYVMAKLPEFFLKDTGGMQVAEALTEYRAKQKPGQQTIVEATDYVAGNSRADCNVWIVYGSILTSDDKDQVTNAVIYWYVFDQTEVEIVEYVSRGFYKVGITTTQVRNFLDKNKDKVSICTGFAAGAVHFPIAEVFSDDNAIKQILQ